MPTRSSAIYSGYNTSPECWSVYTEVLASEFGNAVLFGQVHQLAVLVRQRAEAIWRAWSPHHGAIAAFVSAHIMSYGERR